MLAERQETALRDDDLTALDAILAQKQALIAQLPPPPTPSSTTSPPPVPDQQLAFVSRITAIERRCAELLRQRRDTVRAELLERAAHARVTTRYGAAGGRRTPRFVDKAR